ncbi:MAG: PQQ-binding-like beta-propeller repeat protein [Firmicutes bacterium]|nr:PQQ-binding-like beta-propeller repeat protein [Bacillota bacterium]
MKTIRKVIPLFLLLVIILAASLTLRAETIIPDPSWPMFRHDAVHTGFASCGAPFTNGVLWQTDIGLPIYSSPAVVDRKVFFGVRDQALALDSRTGKAIWKAPMVGEIYSSPAVDPLALKTGLVYIASYGSKSSTLSAFEMNTGTPVWRIWASTKSSPTVAANPPIMIQDPNSPLPIPRATVYIGSGTTLLALDADTGKTLWKYEATGVIDSTPAVDAGIVYFGTNGNMVYALNRFSGNPVWKFGAKGAVVSSPAVGEKFIIFGDTAGVMYCLEKATGNLIWTYYTGGSITSSPAYASGEIYIGVSNGLNGTLYKFSDYGIPLWKVPVPGEVHSSPCVAGGKVYTGSSGSRSSAIFCFNAASGAQLWFKWMMMYSSPSAAEANFLYTTTLEGTVYAFTDWE